MSCGYERPLSAWIPQRRRLCHALPSNAKCTAKKWGLLGQLLANAHANKAFNCNPKDSLLRADLNVLIYTYIRNARIDVFFIRRGIFLSALRAQSNTNNSNNDKEQRGASQVARAQLTDYTFAYTEVFFFPFFRLAGGTSLTRLPPLFFGPWMRRGCCLNECAMLMHFFCNNARHTLAYFCGPPGELQLASKFARMGLAWLWFVCPTSAIGEEESGMHIFQILLLPKIC